MGFVILFIRYHSLNLLMKSKTGVVLSIVAIAAVVLVFASGPLVASAQAFPGFGMRGFGGGFGFHRGFGFNHFGFGFRHPFFGRGFGFGGFPGWGWGGGWGGGCGGCGGCF
jgi:hypothetical protein